MAYSKKVATGIIGSDGKVYDEDPRGMIAVPFESEFKIRVINKNSRKIGFDIFIDGVKTTKTGRIIVNAHDRIDLERWVENDNNGTKFRFVPKNSEEAKMEGKDKEKYTGVVEVRAYLEKERPKEIIREVHHDHYWDHPRHYDWPYRPYIYCSAGGYSGFSGSGNATRATVYGGSITNSTQSNNFSLSAMNTSDMSNAVSYNFTSSLEEGAVVKGSNSNQSFCSTYVDLEEDYISLKMYIMGYYQPEYRDGVRPMCEDRIKAEKQMEFDFMGKKYCTKCGHVIKADDNFCGKCGEKNV